MSFPSNKFKLVSESKGNSDASVAHLPPPLNLCIVINILYYIKPFSRLIVMAEPLDKIGSEVERQAFLSLKKILTALDGKADINIHPFLDKFCHYTQTNSAHFAELDISFIWDNTIKLITVVIPPLREVFLGKICGSFDVHAWLNLATKCFRAQFHTPIQSLDEIIRLTLVDEESKEQGAESKSGGKDNTVCGGNKSILHRSPEILVFSVESSLLPSSKHAEAKAGAKGKPCTDIRFPSSFDLSPYIPLPPNIHGSTNSASAEEDQSRIYDICSVVVLDGQAYESIDACYRIIDDKSTSTDGEPLFV